MMLSLTRDPPQLWGAVWLDPPALAAVHVTGGVRQLLDTGPRAVTLLATHQGVATEALWLADQAVRGHSAWRTDALACELITQAGPAVAGCWGGQYWLTPLPRSRPRCSP